MRDEMFWQFSFYFILNTRTIYVERKRVKGKLAVDSHFRWSFLNQTRVSLSEQVESLERNLFFAKNKFFLTLIVCVHVSTTNWGPLIILAEFLFLASK